MLPSTLTESLRITTIPLVLLLALLAWRDHRRAPGVNATVALLLGVACHLALPLALARDVPALLVEGLALGALSVPLTFWAASRGLFEDDFRLRPTPLVTLAALLALRYAAWLGIAGEATADPALFSGARPVELASSLLAAAVVLDSLRRLHAGARIDLVGLRLRQRRLVLGVAGLYMLVVLAGELMVRGTELEPAAARAEALLVLVLVVAVSWRLVRVDTSLLAPRRPAAEPRAELAPVRGRLEKLIHDEQVYRTDGLTIRGLAQRLGDPEHRVRQVINTELGFRNFNAFLNHWRVEEARRLLEAPEGRELGIAELAFRLGYSSLGPFNRAFKDLTGQTPSEYRSRGR